MTSQKKGNRLSLQEWLSLLKFQTRDVIALLVLVFGFVLLLNGVNGTVALIMTMVVTYYFRKRTEEINLF